MNELQGWIDLVQKGGLALAVVVLAIGGMRQWYVWGWLYHDVVRDRDEWKGIALRGVNLAENAVVASTVRVP